MKLIYNILKFALWTLVGLYLLIILFVHIPSVESFIADRVEDVVSKTLNTKCVIEGIKLGYLDRVVVKDIVIYDQQDSVMLKAKRVAIVPDILSILKGEIFITSAQLLSADINVYKQNEKSPLNIQFVIDSLNSDKKSEDKTNVRINTIILRNTSIAYNLLYKPKQEGLDFNHLNVSKLSANVMIKNIQGDEIDLDVKKLEFKEKSGFKLNKLTLSLKKKGSDFIAEDFVLKMNDIALQSDKISANLDKKSVKTAIKGLYKDLKFSSFLSFDDNKLIVNKLRVNDTPKNIKCDLSAVVDFQHENEIRWDGKINGLYLNVPTIKNYYKDLPVELESMKFIDFTGDSKGSIKDGNLETISGYLKGFLKSNIGTLDVDVNKSWESLKLIAKTDGLNIAEVLPETKIDDITSDLDISIKGVDVVKIKSLKQLLQSNIDVKGKISNVTIDGKSYTNITADASLVNNVLSGKAGINDKKYFCESEFNLDVKEIFNKKVYGTLSASGVRIENISIGDVDVRIEKDGVSLKSTLADAELSGDYTIPDFSGVAVLKDLHSIGGITGIEMSSNNPVNLNFSWHDDVQKVLLESKDINIESLKIHNLNLNVLKEGNVIHTSIAAENANKMQYLKGLINSDISINKTSQGKDLYCVDMKPSTLVVGDSIWNISSSKIKYSDKNLSIDGFKIEHNDKSITINGTTTSNSGDSLIIGLNDIDVAYVLDYVDFHSVEFSGQASGQAIVKSLFSTPKAYAKLEVKDFMFEQGCMGVLFADAKWNNAEGCIDIDAICKDEERRTKIDGYVSPTKNCLDLSIKANNTRGEFLKSFCGSFLDKIDVTANGNTRVFGDFSKVQMTGLLAVSGSARVKPLGVEYYMNNIVVDFQPDEIIFPGDTIFDKYKNKGILTGQLHHKNLTRLTFDLNAKVNNLLCYDIPIYGDEVFFGKAFATGSCDMIGRSGSITFNVDCQAEKGSFIEYNASNPDAIIGQQFITWHDGESQESEFSISKTVDDTDDYHSDLYLNINCRVNPNCALKVLMDSNSGDKITLFGNGDLRATYYNKGKFNLFGTYQVESGNYNMTIQNLIQKRFQFLSGSSIVFGGEPYEAQLSLKALYPVNGVSLSDLQIGNSFKSNNVKVDCLMNISGTPEQPMVDFDFELPNVNSDAAQMVHSLINSQQEINQQVIYLLTLGRFFSQDATTQSENSERQSQTSLVMQSLLSGTISQQINNLLGSVTKDNSWNFGANISTGDEGFNNAEYEGILSGSLFNNRLQINGQVGYRDNQNATSSFIGDFDVRYLLFPNGNFALRVYNQNNDRYFTRSSLNTQGLGFILKYDFHNIFKKKSKAGQVRQ